MTNWFRGMDAILEASFSTSWSSIDSGKLVPNPHSSAFFPSIDGKKAEEWGLGTSFPESILDQEVEKLASRMASIPRNQLVMQKMMVNQSLENMGLASSQTLAAFFDGIARHTPEGVNFKNRAEEIGWKEAVRERDQGIFDWTEKRPVP